LALPIICLIQITKVNAQAPTQPPTGFGVAGATTSSITLTWTAPAMADPNRTNYLILANTVGVFTNPVNGIAVTNDLDLTDGTAASFGTIGAAATSFNGFIVNPGTQYHFKLIPYNAAGTSPPQYYLASLITTTGFTEPVQSTNITFVNRQATTMDVNWNSGGGSNRILVGIQAASFGVFQPTDGANITVTPSSNFTDGTNGDLGGGYRLLFSGAGSGVSNITNLVANTQYSFKVFDFVGNAALTNFNEDDATNNPQTISTLFAEPTNQPTVFSITNKLETGLGYTVNYVAATGAPTGYLVLRKIGVSSPVSTPVDGTAYTAGAPIGDATVAFVDNAAALTFNETLLATSTQYSYAIYSFNGSGPNINYFLTSPLTGTAVTLAVEPSAQPTTMTFSSLASTGYNVGFTVASGSPTGYLAIRRATAGSPTGVPADGQVYAVTDILGDGTVVMVGTTNPFSQTLSAETEYFYDIYSFNGSGNSINYRQSSAPLEGNRFTLSSQPSNQSGVITASAVATTTNIDIGLPNNTGLTNTDGVIILRAQGGTAPTTTGVVDGTAPGSLVLPVGTILVTTTTSLVASTFTDVGPLLPNTQYAYTVITYNANAGVDGETFNYFTSSVRSASATTSCVPPSTQASVFSSPAKTTNSIDLSWTRGDGDKVIVIGRQSSTNNLPTLTPGLTYSANPIFGSGSTIAVSGNDYSVLFIGTITSFTVTGLDAATAYSFAIYEFNDSGGGVDPECYSATPATLANIVTDAANISSTITGGIGVALIPSTTNADPGVNSFSFTVNDLGDDGVDTDISQIIIRAGAGNEVTDWTQVIQAVALVDNAGNGAEDYASAVVATSPNRITISTIVNNGDDKLGDINNAASKTFTLRVWIKANLGVLKTTIDNQNFEFTVAAADFITANSGIEPSQNASSNAANNRIDVVASQLNITQQPSTSANATVALAQQPAFEATDVNGNRDLDFNTAISAVNTGNPDNLSPAFSPTNFSSGVATFTDLRFNNIGTSTMSATAGFTSPNSNATTVTAATTLAGGAVGINPGPNINNSTINQAVFGFSLQTTGSILNFTGATVSTTSDPDAVFNNIRLFSSIDNDFATAVDNTNLSTGTTPGNTINFTGFSSALSGITKFFFVVADVKASFPTNMPTIQLSLTTGNVIVSIGNVVGSTQTGTTYTFIDSTPPLITSITNTVNPIFEGALTQTVVVRFNESMKTVGFDPVISLTGTNWGAQTTVGWSTTTNTNDTYTATFTHTATQETIGAAVASITVNTPQDVAGNVITNAPTSSAPFVVDNQKPTATVATSPATITTNNLSALQVVVTYNESMNPGFNPTIILSGGSFDPIPSGVWSTATFTNDTYTVTGITHTGAGQTIPSVTATASGARDARGNVQVASPASNAFAIDTQRPTVVSVNRQNPATALPINNTSVIYRVVFSEAVAGIDPTDFTKVLTGTLTAPAPVTVNPVSATTYDVTVSSLSGDGTLRLDILNTAILTDTPGNTYNANFTTGQIYTIDNTPPLLTALNPLDNKLAVPLPATVASQWTITLNENVKAGTGNLEIRRVSDDVSVGLIDINGPAVGISGSTVTLTPFNNIPAIALAEGENYYVQIPSGVILDIANNAYAGFINNTSWNFQTFATPQITNIVKSASANTLAACVGETLTVTGNFFAGFTNPEGITRIDFREITSGYVNSVTNPADITVISDNQLTVVVPNDVNLNERIQLQLWTALDNTGIGTNPARTSALSVQNVEMGAQSVAFNILGPVNLCNDPANGAPTGFDFQLTIPSGTASSYTMNYTVNGVPASFNYIRNSTNQFAPPTNPTPTFIHNYALTTITDNFGCPSPGVNTTVENITKYTRAIPTIDPVPPIILSQGAGPVTLTGHIEGSVTSGAWSSVGGLGSFAPGAFASGTSPVTRTTDYTFSPVDFTNPTITFRLTTPNAATVNPSNPCAGDTFDVIATISGTPLGNDICTGDPTTTVTGFVSGNPTDATLTILSRVPVPVTPGFWQSNGNPSAVTQNPLGPSQSISQIYEWSSEEIANNTVITIQLSWTDGTVKTDDLEIKRQPVVTLGAAFPTQFSQSDPEILIPLNFNPPVVDVSEITFTGAGIRLSTAAGFEWFFDPSSVAPGPNPISFTYDKSGCQSTINTVVNVFSGGLIFASGPNAGNPVGPAICVNDAFFDIQLNSSNEDFSNVTNIQGAIVESFNPITKVARINPSLVGNFLISGGLASADFEIIYFAPAFTGPRTAQTITVNGRPSLDFTGFPTSFVCGDNSNITLTKGANNPEPTFSFFTNVNPAIVTPAGGNNYTLDPRQAEANLFNLADNDDFVPKLLQVFYTYTNNLGCSDTTSVMVNIRRQPPQPVLTDPDNLICVTSGSIQSVSIANLANSGVSGAGALLDWSVSAAFVVNSNQVDFVPATLQQNAATPYFVRQSIAGCTSATTNFLYERINFDDNSSNFNGSSFSIDAPITYSANLSFLDASITPSTLEWQLVDNIGSIVQTSPVLPATGGLNQHAFTITQANAFLVRSILETARSCRDTLAVQVLAVERVVVNDISNAYEQDFEGTKPGLWIPTATPFTGWEQGVANKTLIQSGSQGNVWVTSLAGAYAVNQKYYLYSPSFDITGLGRPMISLDHWVNADLDNDGAVLEFSVDGLNPLDPSKQWFAVGFKDSGREWYTSDNLQSQVGSGRIIKSGSVLTGFHGWSGTTTDWTQSSFVLDQVKLQALASGNEVIFRMGFGSIGPLEDKDGFAFDNVRIGNRTRTVLLENFRNAGNASASEQTVNNAITQFTSQNIGTQLLLLNYHVGFPDFDPFNEDNTADPSSRALFYGISQTPLSRLDGDDGGLPQVPFTQWGEDLFNIRTLQLGFATIAFDPSTGSLPDGTIRVKADVTPFIDLDENTILHIAIVEDTVSVNILPPAKQSLIKSGESGFNFVLKKLLPSAVGTRTGFMPSGVTKTFEAIWEPNPAIFYRPTSGAPNLSVIIFLQNEITREVYQAEVITNIPYPPIITGLEDILDAGRITVFPNPADQELTMQLPEEATRKIELQLVDQMGRSVFKGHLMEGEKEKTISTRNIASGIYLLQLGAGDVGARKKVMIVHK